MAAAEDILRNFNLFIDGIGYAGNVESFSPPNLALATEDFTAAGMIAPLEVETGLLNKLEASFTLTKIAPEVEARLGNWLKPISLTARGAIQDFDGNVKECVVKLTGKIKSVEAGEWTPGAAVKPKYNMSVTYYHKRIAGVPVHIVDVKNMVAVIGGTDIFADVRKALGIETSAASIGANVVGI